MTKTWRRKHVARAFDQRPHRLPKRLPSATEVVPPCPRCELQDAKPTHSLRESSKLSIKTMPAVSTSALWLAAGVCLAVRRSLPCSEQPLAISLSVTVHKTTPCSVQCGLPVSWFVKIRQSHYPKCNVAMSSSSAVTHRHVFTGASHSLQRPVDFRFAQYRPKHSAEVKQLL